MLVFERIHTKKHTLTLKLCICTLSFRQQLQHVLEDVRRVDGGRDENAMPNVMPDVKSASGVGGRTKRV